MASGTTHEPDVERRGLRWFARDRAALLRASRGARRGLPEDVFAIMRDWGVNGRPFYVETEKSNDLYGFDAAGLKGAPAWWVVAVAQWQKGKH